MAHDQNGAAPGKDFDLVLFGATGFTGQLTAEYLTRRAPGIRWALAGRSLDKLQRVRAELAAIDPGVRDLPLIVGDSLDPASVEAMVRRTRVVCTTVGPYARYGGPLVAACAEHGVHYCDLTGEPPFIRAMIDAHHDRAAATGARVVHCCGFDSIPSDLGVLMMHEHLAARGQRLSAARYRVLEMKGGPSGGTVASLFGVLEDARTSEGRRVLFDPYSLNPAGERRGDDGRDQNGARRDDDSGHWTAPFMMAAINTRVVRRSNALLDFPYGRDFRYDEAMDMGPGPLGFVRAAALSAGIGAVMAAAILPPTRALIDRVLPAAGEGPSREDQARGFFRIVIHGRSGAGERVTGRVEATGDPGYAATSMMLGESALCLAQDALPARGGVLTPASAMGMTLLERLRAAGMTFRVE